MSKAKSYEENVLLKLRRDYAQDEAVQFISNELSKARVENGILLSELAEARDKAAELEAENQLLKGDMTVINEQMEQWAEERNSEKHQIEKLQKENEKLRQVKPRNEAEERAANRKILQVKNNLEIERNTTKRLQKELATLKKEHAVMQDLIEAFKIQKPL